MDIPPDAIKTAQRLLRIIKTKQTGWSLDRIDDESVALVARALLHAADAPEG